MNTNNKQTKVTKMNKYLFPNDRYKNILFPTEFNTLNSKKKHLMVKNYFLSTAIQWVKNH